MDVGPKIVLDDHNVPVVEVETAGWHSGACSCHRSVEEDLIGLLLLNEEVFLMFGQMAVKVLLLFYEEKLGRRGLSRWFWLLPTHCFLYL